MSKASSERAGGDRKRAYDNSLREARARETRERIVEGVVKACLEGSLDDLSVALVARRTGISAATIYRHFPNREVLLEAVDRRLGEKLGRPEMPRSAEEFAEVAAKLPAFFEEHLELMRLARSTSDKLDKESQSLRDRYISELLAAETAHLEPEEARAICAIFRGFFSLDLYLLQRDRFGVAPKTAGRAAEWAIRTLLAQLERERQGHAASKPTSSPPSSGPGEPS
jgi:AcrR family transcriptional regulator